MGSADYLIGACIGVAAQLWKRVESEREEPVGRI